MLSFALMIDNDSDRLKVEAIFARYHGTMMKTAMSILQSNTAAEDAVSESIVKLIRNIHKVGEIDSYRTRGFVVIIVKRTCFDILKKQNRNLEVRFDEFIETNMAAPSILDDLCARECCDRLMNTILALPHIDSEILFLQTQYEYTIPELAVFLGISRDAVKMRLSRARKKLASALEKEAECSAKAE